MTEYCCDKFGDIIEKPESVYNRETTFHKLSNDKNNEYNGWWTNFSDGEYGDIPLKFCPFCGASLDKYG